MESYCPIESEVFCLVSMRNRHSKGEDLINVFLQTGEFCAKEMRNNRIIFSAMRVVIAILVEVMQGIRFKLFRVIFYHGFKLMLISMGKDAEKSYGIVRYGLLCGQSGVKEILGFSMTYMGL
ncbi:hypothetical protein TorRG33x02_258470 [Trema orientale]|uniref:Uncharacterized protein n=1 Tax=Trema orientale TaxID=63057 RepID=A0A2P5D9B2_TREOI|nr:hypothetical protein TorRG33x02_258470 [Trema orientale]